MTQADAVENAVPTLEVPPVPEVPSGGAIDTADVNFNIEPDFTDDGNAVKYEIRAESLCMAQANAFKANKAAVALAQVKRASAFRPLVRHLAILKAVKLGRGGRDSDWGATVGKLDGLKIRTVDRWITKEVSHGELPLWAVKRLMAHAKPQPPDPPKKIEITPLSLDERKQFLAAVERLTMKSGSETVWQVIFDAVTQHPDAQEPKKVTGIPFVDGHDGGLRPETILAQMERHETAAAGAVA